MKNLLEVCAGGYFDCLEAEEGGATRVELNTALSLGGLTPTISTLKLVKEKTKLEVISMVRPRGAGFHYLITEKEDIFANAKDLLEAGSDGLAFGFLHKNGTVEVEETKMMVDLIHSYGKTAVFHKAVDVSRDLDESMEVLIELGVDRVLTSGGERNVNVGMEKLKYLNSKYGDKIEILAGGGVDDLNAKKLIEYTGIRQVHSSCKNYVKDPTTKNNKLSYAYLDALRELYFEVVDSERVRKVIDAIK